MSVRLAGDAPGLWAIALATVVFALLLPFTAGLVGAAVLCVLIAPLLRRITAPRQRRVAAFALMFLCFFALVLPGVWLLGELLAQIPDVVRQVQENVTMRRVMTVHLGDIELGNLLRQATNEIVSWSSRQTISAINGAVNSTLNLVVALFGAYYLLNSGDVLWERVRNHLPVAAPVAEAMRLRFHRVTEAMVLGVVLASVAQGTLLGAALWALGFEHYLLWGGITAVASVLPIFGSALVWVPACGALLANGRFGAAMFLTLYGALVVSNVDNVLRLVVYNRVSQIHPMITLVGAFAGVKAFGVAGLLIGPLLLSYAAELVTLRPAAVGELPDIPQELADKKAGAGRHNVTA